MKMKLQITLLCLLSIFAFTKCSKNDSNSNIPFVTVDLQLNIDNPSNFAIQVIGGWVYINGGSKGIIVYRVSDVDFRAYDRHSPYQPDDNCVVEVESSSLYAEDPCSGSRFQLTDGSVSKGPANQALKQYRTEFDGTFLRIFN